MGIRLTHIGDRYIAGMVGGIQLPSADMSDSWCRFQTTSPSSSSPRGTTPPPQPTSSYTNPLRSYWFPFTILAWGLLTLGTFRVTSVTQIYIIRFFQGFFEASSFVGTHFILGSWYTESELAKRSGIFTASGLAGTMFSGFLQGEIHKSLHETRGISGWRWLFVIDFAITAPVALYGFLCFPDTPATTKAFYLSKEERELAVSRMPKRKETKLSWDIFRRVFGRWYVAPLPRVGEKWC